MGGRVQVGQILGALMITLGLSCDRVGFGHFAGGSDDPRDRPPPPPGYAPGHFICVNYKLHI